MSSRTISITPCTPHVGAEIGNIDLTRPLSGSRIRELYAAFVKHGVIFFREQDITYADQMRLAGYFGHGHVHVGGAGTASRPVPDYPAIRRQHFDRDSRRISGGSDSASFSGRPGSSSPPLK